MSDSWNVPASTPMNSAQLEAHITRLAGLPTLPVIVRRIAALLENPETNVKEISALIAQDQVLSVRILRLVNSPLYGFPRRISSLTHALVLLGFNVVKGIVLSTAIFDAFGKNLPGLWAHSLGCAIVSRLVARIADASEPEEAMVAGLLHDLGKAVLSSISPEGFNRAVAIAEERNCHISDAEREVFGMDHAQAAGLLAIQWRLPDTLVSAMREHHSPQENGSVLTSVVHVADVLARGLGYGFPGDSTMPKLNHAAYERLALLPEQIDAIVKDAETEYSAQKTAFE